MTNSNDIQHKQQQSKIQINVKIEGYYCDINDKFEIESVYLKDEKMRNVFNKIINKLNKKYYPLKLGIEWIESESFTGSIYRYDVDKTGNKSITEYDLNDIKKKGLKIQVRHMYNHEIKNASIDCEYMNKCQSSDAKRCPIYTAMKEKYEWNKENLNHLNEYRHFGDEYNDKAECKYNDGCKAYIRMENGGNDIKDQCHLKLYRHPPRKRNIKLAKNINAFIFNKKKQECHDVYEPTEDDRKQYKYNDNDGYLYALIEEVIANGFKNDLCLLCASDSGIECPHNEYTILSIVDEKMEHYRHKTMGKPLTRGRMLSLILYTGCECNYDLCTSQRNGDYNKWKWFDYCLWWAICILSFRERGSYVVFSGLQNVKLSIKSVECGYFRTFVSTSWNETVAKMFMKGNGMIINIDKEFRNGLCVYCCDVSWISKFADECEVLFARSTSYYGDGKFKCIVLDETNNIQSVSLKKS